MTGALGGVLLVAGLAFVLIGVIGILRLPDFYTRLHAASKCDTVGLALMVAGVAVHTGWSPVTGKVLLVALVVALVNAVGAHAIARAAYRSGQPPWTAGAPRR